MVSVSAPNMENVQKPFAACNLNDHASMFFTSLKKFHGTQMVQRTLAYFNKGEFAPPPQVILGTWTRADRNEFLVHSDELYLTNVSWEDNAILQTAFLFFGACPNVLSLEKKSHQP